MKLEVTFILTRILDDDKDCKPHQRFGRVTLTANACPGHPEIHLKTHTISDLCFS